MVVFPGAMELVEAIPNISEGQSVRLVERIAESFVAEDDIWLLDVHRDPSHHRSVLTAVAWPEALPAACCSLAERALELIDLRRHRGVHPRIGALDVLPFVPLMETSRAKVVQLAREVAEELASRFQIPVFLYGLAASSSQRPELSELRRFGFEGLVKRLASKELVPDFGPQRPHATGGAIAVGVRDVLIAYNVLLSTHDVAVARAIARRIRASSGGLPHVKALGVELAHRGLTQVSMNLTDYRVTSLLTAYDAVKESAEEVGVEVESSEIVGLIPEAAVFSGMVERLKLESAPGVLEHRIRSCGVLGPSPGRGPAT